MSFHGKPAPQASIPAKIRTYRICLENGQTDTVEADFVSRDPGHVCFWRTRPDNKQDTLVVAIANHLIEEFREETAS